MTHKFEYRDLEGHQKPLAKLREDYSIGIGNGMKVSFWEDNWLEQGSLKPLFPDIYILKQQQKDTVAEVWSNRDGI